MNTPMSIKRMHLLAAMLLSNTALCHKTILIYRSLSIAEARQEIPRQLEAQPTTGHARCHLEQVGHDSLEKPSNSLFGHDDSHSIPDGRVPVPHPRHRIDLEASSQNIAAALLNDNYQRHGPRSYNGYVHVWATAPEMAPASSLRIALGFLSPSGVRYLRTDSYVMKLRPTWTTVNQR
jgi:hypothetical protein